MGDGEHDLRSPRNRKLDRGKVIECGRWSSMAWGKVELAASVPRRASPFDFFAAAFVSSFPHILSTVSNNPKVLPYRVDFPFPEQTQIEAQPF